jgi:DNA-binding NarL/FixJ family response regulator
VDVTRPIRLILIDDELRVRQGLRMCISAEPDMEVVGEAADGQAARQLAGRLHPDVVVMDLHMRGMDGLEATRQVRAAIPGTVVIMLSLEDDAQARKLAAEAGASAFVSKQEGLERLLAAIRESAGAPRISA